MKARRKPVEVFAIHYNETTIVEELLKLLRANKEEPVRFDPYTRNIYIRKERGEITLALGNWIVEEKNTDGSFWVVDKDIFLKSYTRIKGTLYSYRKKVYEVECIKFKDLSEESIFEILSFMDNNKPVYISREYLNSQNSLADTKENGYIIIPTLEGDEKMYPGEVLIKGVEGEFYPVKPENFDKVYDIIEY